MQSPFSAGSQLSFSVKLWLVPSPMPPQSSSLSLFPTELLAHIKCTISRRNKRSYELLKFLPNSKLTASAHHDLFPKCTSCFDFLTLQSPASLPTASPHTPSFSTSPYSACFYKLVTSYSLSVGSSHSTHSLRSGSSLLLSQFKPSFTLPSRPLS